MGAAVALAASLGLASGTAACGGGDGPGSMDAAPAQDGAAMDDAANEAVIEVAHLPQEAAYVGQGSVQWADGTVVDTTDLTIDGAGVPGNAGGDAAPDIAFDQWSQPTDEPGPGPELAVLHVGDLTIPAGARVRVTGLRPLVIVAAGDVVVDGILDASARGSESGPGGAGPGSGPGAGQDGLFDENDPQDSGGGGGGHATEGARGGKGCYRNCYSGTTDLDGGSPGQAYGDAVVTVLRGGASGGAGGTAADGCASGQGGAGGGALQIYAATAVRIGAEGGIDVGGGGGGGGVGEAGCVPAAGGGGGSGGAIYLQAPVIRNQGVLAANGGSGGGGAGDGGSGTAGEDGRLGDTRADAGLGASGGGATGGRGAAGTGQPQPGPDYDTNGGGGGGAAGRIVLQAVDLGGAGITSPPAEVLPVP